MGYRQPYVQTGYEEVLAHRTTDLFAYTAKEDGRVIQKSDKGILIELASGEQKAIELGRRFSRAEGSLYPHDVVSPLAMGDVFSKGAVIAYNTGFFEPDFMNPKAVVWKSGIFVKTALYESSQTHEDSSSISTRAAALLTSELSKEMSFTVSFDQGVRQIPKIGTSFKPTDTLFIIEDAVTNQSGLFDEETLSTLQKLSNKAPKSKYYCVLDHIEVFYHGDKADMSDSLKALANQSDKELAARYKALGKSITSGRVTDDYRVAGTPLALQTAEIKFYLTMRNIPGQGDWLN